MRNYSGVAQTENFLFISLLAGRKVRNTTFEDNSSGILSEIYVLVRRLVYLLEKNLKCLDLS